MKTTNTPTAAALSRTALADARAKHATWTELSEEAETAAAELFARLDSGDEDVSETALMTADYRITRSARLVRAFEKAVSAAQAGLINDDTRLADLFVPVLYKTTDGAVPVQVVTTRGEVKTSKPGEAVIFLVQEKATTNDGGILSGELAVVYLRPRLYAALDTDAIEATAEALGYRFHVSPGASFATGDQHQDNAVVRVDEAFPAVPELDSAPSEGAVEYFARGVSSRVHNAVAYRGERIGVRLIGDGDQADSSCDLTGHQIMSTATDAEGIHRMTVEVSLKVFPSRNLTASPHHMIVQAIERHEGLVEPGTGRVSSAKVTDIKAPEPVPGVRPRWDLTAQLVLSYRLTDSAA